MYLVAEEVTNKTNMAWKMGQYGNSNICTFFIKYNYNLFVLFFWVVMKVSKVHFYFVWLLFWIINADLKNCYHFQLQIGLGTYINWSFNLKYNFYMWYLHSEMVAYYFICVVQNSFMFGHLKTKQKNNNNKI